MQTNPVKYESWICDGDLWEVTTIKQQGESQEDFCARHESAVSAAMAICPPD